MSKKVYVSEIRLKKEIILLNNKKKITSLPISEMINVKTTKEVQDELDEINDLIIKYENSTVRNKQDQLKVIIDKLSNMYISDYSNDEFGKMVMLMVNKFATRPQFSGYTEDWLSDMKLYAIELIFRYLYNFNPLMISPKTGTYVSSFSYITQIIYNAFIHTINVNKTQNDVNKIDISKLNIDDNLANIYSTYKQNYSINQSINDEDNDVKDKNSITFIIDDINEEYDNIINFIKDKSDVHVEILYMNDIISLDTYKKIDEIFKNNLKNNVSVEIKKYIDSSDSSDNSDTNDNDINSDKEKLSDTFDSDKFENLFKDM